jgi:tetratricopeptide (TPR) repeat protein/predicted Ser/Thr protein kinase
LFGLVDCPDAEALAQLAAAGGDPAWRGAIADHASSCESCHAALVAVLGSGLEATLAEDEIGAPAQPQAQIIDRYVVRRRLGAGGMGVVFEAHDPELDRDVAIKMLRGGASAERLRREAQALARLSHPNVVAVHDVGEHQGQVFVAMALVAGDNLRQWLATPRSGAEIVRVLCSAGRGIVAAHDANLIHRDLKPDNIFVARTGEVLVGDFGLARDRSDADDDAGADTASGDLTLTGSVLGTPAYMAPEQAAGAATTSSDQFSFCVTAYEALYGTRPFGGTSLGELVASIERGELAPPLRDPDVPPRVLRALRRGLAAEPAARFPRLADLLAAIAPRARRWPWVAAASTALVATVATTWVVTREPEAPDPAVTCAPWKTPPAQKATTELAARLVARTSEWTAVRHETCLAGATRRLTPEQLSARVACLDAHKASLDAAIASSDPDMIWKRVAALPDATACRDDKTARLWSGDAAHLMRMQALARARDAVELAALERAAISAGDLPAQLAIALAVAATALDENRQDMATASLRRAVRLAEQLDVPSARVRALALSGRALCIQGRDDESEQLLEMAEAGARGLTANHAGELDETLDARAECLYRRSSLAEAQPLLAELLSRALRRHGPDSPEVFALRGRLGIVYRELGRRDDAARELAEWHRVGAKYFTPREAAAQAEEMAAVKALEGNDIHVAVEHQRRAAATWAALRSPLQAISLVDLAMMYDALGAWRSAVETYAEALRLMPANPDEEGWKIRTEAHVARGETLMRLGQADAAVPDFERAVAEGTRLRRADLVLRARLGLGTIAVAQREYARAIRILNEAIPLLAKSIKPSPYALGEAQFALAQATWETADQGHARELGREAEANLSRSIAEMRAHPLGKPHVAFREARLQIVARWRDTHR